MPSHRRKQGLDLGGSWVLDLGTFTHPISPGGWGWIQWGWRWMWCWPVLCPRVRQLLWWGGSALTGCLCLPRGPYIRHKLSPGLMFDFVWRINIRQLECCAPTKPSSPERAASAKTGGGGDRAGEWSVVEPRGLLATFPKYLGRDSGLRVQGRSELIFRGLGAERNW